MTEREALSLLVAMGYTSASSGARTVELSDMLDELIGEGLGAVVDFWPSCINLWRIRQINGTNTMERTLLAVINKKH